MFLFDLSRSVITSLTSSFTNILVKTSSSKKTTRRTSTSIGYGCAYVRRWASREIHACFCVKFYIDLLAQFCFTDSYYSKVNGVEIWGFYGFLLIIDRCEASKYLFRTNHFYLSCDYERLYLQEEQKEARGGV